MMPSEPAIDNAQGSVETVAVVVMGQTENDQAGGKPGGLQGQGVLLSYKMTAKTGINKVGQLKLLDTGISDPTGNSIDNLKIEDARVTIGTP